MSSEPVQSSNPSALDQLEEIRIQLGLSEDTHAWYWRGIQDELIKLFRLGYKIVPPTPLSEHYVQAQGGGHDYYWSQCSCGDYATSLTREGITSKTAQHQHEQHPNKGGGRDE